MLPRFQQPTHASAGAQQHTSLGRQAGSTSSNPAYKPLRNQRSSSNLKLASAKGIQAGQVTPPVPPLPSQYKTINPAPAPPLRTQRSSANIKAPSTGLTRPSGQLLPGPAPAPPQPRKQGHPPPAPIRTQKSLGNLKVAASASGTRRPGQDAPPPPLPIARKTRTPPAPLQTQRSLGNLKAPAQSRTRPFDGTEPQLPPVPRHFDIAARSGTSGPARRQAEHQTRDQSPPAFPSPHTSSLEPTWSEGKHKTIVKSKSHAQLGLRNQPTQLPARNTLNRQPGSITSRNDPNQIGRVQSTHIARPGVAVPAAYPPLQPTPPSLAASTPQKPVRYPAVRTVRTRELDDRSDLDSDSEPEFGQTDSKESGSSGSAAILTPQLDRVRRAEFQQHGFAVRSTKMGEPRAKSVASEAQYVRTFRGATAVAEGSMYRRAQQSDPIDMPLEALPKPVVKRARTAGDGGFTANPRTSAKPAVTSGNAPLGNVGMAGWQAMKNRANAPPQADQQSDDSEAEAEFDESFPTTIHDAEAPALRLEDHLRCFARHPYVVFDDFCDEDLVEADLPSPLIASIQNLSELYARQLPDEDNKYTLLFPIPRMVYKHHRLVPRYIDDGSILGQQNRTVVPMDSLDFLEPNTVLVSRSLVHLAMQQAQLEHITNLSQVPRMTAKAFSEKFAAYRSEVLQWPHGGPDHTDFPAFPDLFSRLADHAARSNGTRAYALLFKPFLANQENTPVHVFLSPGISMQQGVEEAVTLFLAASAPLWRPQKQLRTAPGLYQRLIDADDPMPADLVLDDGQQLPPFPLKIVPMQERDQEGSLADAGQPHLRELTPEQRDAALIIALNALSLNLDPDDGPLLQDTVVSEGDEPTVIYHTDSAGIPRVYADSDGSSTQLADIDISADLNIIAELTGGYGAVFSWEIHGDRVVAEVHPSYQFWPDHRALFTRMSESIFRSIRNTLLLPIIVKHAAADQLISLPRPEEHRQWNEIQQQGLLPEHVSKQDWYYMPRKPFVQAARMNFKDFPTPAERSNDIDYEALLERTIDHSWTVHNARVHGQRQDDHLALLLKKLETAYSQSEGVAEYRDGEDFF